MKIVCLSLLLGFFIGSLCFAQPNFGLNEIGIKVGPNVAGVSKQNIPATVLNPSTLMAFHAGVFGNFYLGKRFFVRDEILYSGKGFIDQSDESIERLHYLSVPLMLYYTPVNNLKVGVGIETNYLLAARTKVGSNTSNASSFYDHDCDIGPMVGLEYDINDKFHVGGRYTLGAENLIGENHFNNEAERTTESVLQNRVFQFYLGYRLLKWSRED